MEIWEPKPTGTLWATPGLLRDTFTFTFYACPLFILVCTSDTAVAQYVSTHTRRRYLVCVCVCVCVCVQHS